MDNAIIQMNGPTGRPRIPGFSGQSPNGRLCPRPMFEMKELEVNWGAYNYWWSTLPAKEQRRRALEATIELKKRHFKRK